MGGLGSGRTANPGEKRFQAEMRHGLFDHLLRRSGDDGHGDAGRSGRLQEFHGPRLELHPAPAGVVVRGEARKRLGVQIFRHGGPGQGLVDQGDGLLPGKPGRLQLDLADGMAIETHAVEGMAIGIQLQRHGVHDYAVEIEESEIRPGQSPSDGNHFLGMTLVLVSKREV